MKQKGLVEELGLTMSTCMVVEVVHNAWHPTTNSPNQLMLGCKYASPKTAPTLLQKTVKVNGYNKGHQF